MLPAAPPLRARAVAAARVGQKGAWGRSSLPAQTRISGDATSETREVYIDDVMNLFFLSLA